MPSLLKPYRPDPFRFRPPKIKRWLYWFFHIQNYCMLWLQFKVFRIHMTPDDLAILKRIKPGASNLLLVNHVNFVDPHIMVEASFRGRFCPKWMAGIEPFDYGRGIFGWFIQSAGAFSVDRGTLDRLAVETAQDVLDEGIHPLVIYPEGEADYTNKVLQSFYSGAAQFAFTTAQNYQDQDMPVYIYPIGISYRFMGNPQDTLCRAIQAVRDGIVTAAQSRGISITNSGIDPHAPLWPQMMGLLHMAMLTLENSSDGFVADSLAPLTLRMDDLRWFLLEGVLKEHLPQETLAKDMPMANLMILKNRLRSIIARKRHAPPLEELQSALESVADLTTQCREGLPGAAHLKRIKRLEVQWVGVARERESIEKRLRFLQRHLAQQIPYAEIRAQATPADLVRWDVQMNDTRRVKMLTLLMADLARQDDSWEGIDEMLVKLEILLFSRFVYRGDKEAVMKLAEPVDVKQYLQAHAGLGKKQLQEQLMAELREIIAGLLVFPTRRQEATSRSNEALSPR
jgi:1-acyl-sn-glycerol-3-phosphate acyltransferase